MSPDRNRKGASSGLPPTDCNALATHGAARQSAQTAAGASPFIPGEAVTGAGSRHCARRAPQGATGVSRGGGEGGNGDLYIALRTRGGRFLFARSHDRTTVSS